MEFIPNYDNISTLDFICIYSIIIIVVILSVMFTIISAIISLSI